MDSCLYKCTYNFLSGIRGLPGIQGPPGSAGYIPPVGFLMTRHSQSTNIPVCPPSMTKLWEGYSLLYVEGNERSHHQDLGRSI